MVSEIVSMERMLAYNIEIEFMKNRCGLNRSWTDEELQA